MFCLNDKKKCKAKKYEKDFTGKSERKNIYPHLTINAKN